MHTTLHAASVWQTGLLCLIVLQHKFLLHVLPQLDEAALAPAQPGAGGVPAAGAQRGGCRAHGALLSIAPALALAPHASQPAKAYRSLVICMQGSRPTGAEAGRAWPTALTCSQPTTSARRQALPARSRPPAPVRPLRYCCTLLATSQSAAAGRWRGPLGPAVNLNLQCRRRSLQSPTSLTCCARGGSAGQNAAADVSCCPPQLHWRLAAQLQRHVNHATPRTKNAVCAPKLNNIFIINESTRVCMDGAPGH